MNGEIGGVQNLFPSDQWGFYHFSGTKILATIRALLAGQFDVLNSIFICLAIFLCIFGLQLKKIYIYLFSESKFGPPIKNSSVYPLRLGLLV